MRHSFRCGQPLGPGVAHHGMRNLVHHAQAHVASPRGERLPAQVADHLSDAAYVVVTVASVGETGYGCHTFYSTDVFRNIVLIADIRLLLCLNIVSCAHINMQFVIFTS